MSNSLKLSDVLSKAELRSLQKKSNLQALRTLSWNWLLIGLAFAMAIVWTNPLTIVLGVLILGSRQLGLGIINHDCAHYSFFKSKAADDFVGEWLAGAPMNISLVRYRTYHLKHHKYAGTADDPDAGLVKSYPVTHDSLKRKFIRDFTGRTGMRDLGYKLKTFKISRHYPWLMFHVALLAVLTVAGAPWAYLMWWAAELFVYPAIVRLRQIGEHGVASNRSDLDPRLNTSTTLAPWWQKLFVAPNNVNYHLEHHYFASIPPYNLRRAHKLLFSRGFYEGYNCVATGYVDVLRRSVRAA